MSEPEVYLLKGPLPPLEKMKAKELREECQMWRNIWGWVPPEVKYYLARTGQQIAVTMRNYKRYLGVLLDTHWTLDEIEIGTVDKVYDVVEDTTYIEKKILRVKVGSIMDLQWIKERKTENEFRAELGLPPKETIPVVPTPTVTPEYEPEYPGLEQTGKPPEQLKLGEEETGSAPADS